MLSRDAKDMLQRLAASIKPDSRSRRSRLLRRDFTIVSNDCWGAEVYKDLDLPFTTPLIGTFVMGPCYMRLIDNCSQILRSQMSFVDRSRYAYVEEFKKLHGVFPTGTLDNGNVEIQFMHYASRDQARTKWERRVSRINDERLFFKLSGDKDEFTNQDYVHFNALPIQHKVAFSRSQHPNLRSVVHVPDWTVDGKFMYERSLRHFDIVSWLNAD